MKAFLQNLENQIEVNGIKIHRIVLVLGILRNNLILQKIKAGRYKKLKKKGENKDVPVF